MTELVVVFLIGLFSSFGHCVGMCGGFVTAYTVRLHASGDISRNAPLVQRIRPHLMYHLGRLTTYVFLGAVFGLIGETMHLIAGMRPYQGILQAVAGVVMIWMGLDMGGWLPSALGTAFPGYGHFKNGIAFLFRRVRKHNILGLGMAMGFIPCGLVYAAGAKAAATGSTLNGMLTMLFFGLGTFPALLAVGLSASAASADVRSKIFKLATVLVIAFGVVTTYRGIQHFFLHAPPHPAATQDSCIH